MLNALIGIVNGRSSEEIMTNTNILNGMYNSPECINSLCGIVINGSIEKQVRLLACVEMRKKVKIHWDSVQKTPIRQSLLDAVFVESDKKLLNAIARVNL